MGTGNAVIDKSRTAARDVVACDLPLSSACLHSVMFIRSSGLLRIISDLPTVTPNGQSSGLILLDPPSASDPVLSVFLGSCLPWASRTLHLPTFTSTPFSVPFAVSISKLQGRWNLREAGYSSRRSREGGS